MTGQFRTARHCSKRWRNICQKKCGDVTKKALSAKEKAQALERASDFKSKYPFLKKYVENKHADVILKALDGRTWFVNYTFGVKEKTPNAKFLNGWKSFAVDKSIDILFEVYIFRENGDSTTLQVHKTATSKVRPRGSFSSKGCTLPYKFAKTHINKIEGDAILKFSDGRYWSVLYKVRDRLNGSPVAKFCRGWSAFVRDNALEQRDESSVSEDQKRILEVTSIRGLHPLMLAELLKQPANSSQQVPIFK
ncbi:hypothetical protein L484_027901 [Morus notabilis]|uniref:TF-B3 domain-containing protein n=1 Tax=Morus notabilis TaxID=981085 RepID=W9S7J0_9ROSA|nr:hypothetical protein L484_027901 [Morus notabilis]